MTVVGSLFALYASANISATMTEIVSRSMPATVESLRLAEEASTLVASAPRLMTASDDKRRDEIARDIAAQSQMLSDRIARLHQLDAGQTDEIEVARAAMVERLDALNQAVTERLKISAQRRALALSVRKVHEDIIEAITPAIDDANFDLMTRNKASGSTAALNQSIEALRRLLEIQSGTNLLSGLLIEILDGDRRRQPGADARPIASAQRSIEGNLKALPQTEQTQRKSRCFIKSSRRLPAITASSRNAPTSSTASRMPGRSMPRRPRRRRGCAMPSKVSIERQGKFAQTLSGRAITQIRVGRILLDHPEHRRAGGRRPDRLALCRAQHRRPADAVERRHAPHCRRRSPMSRSRSAAGDEIAGMAKALLVFRQAIAEVSVARQREADRAEDSEQRRQRVQAATQNFERAVNEVIQALDGASKSMDGCAHIMADAADHNKKRAAAAATASEEATTNVSNVAMAAEEIAQSVEQISTQAARSAHIARQASDETKAIIATVEQLVASVGQINNVSNLIRDVAAQTNLLALNATIEAARAGDRRPRFCRRCPRGEEPRRANREGNRRHHPANFVHRSDDVAGRSGHEGDRRHYRAARRKCQRHFGRSTAAGCGQQRNRPQRQCRGRAHPRGSMSVVQVSDAAAKTEQVATPCSMPAANSRRTQASCAPKSSAFWRRSASRDTPRRLSSLSARTLCAVVPSQALSRM